jgi:class 3 adenylate cyclase
VQRALIEHNENHAEARISVRIGLSVGEPIREDEDMYGTSVIMASRIATKAEGGQVLVSHIAYTLASTSGDFVFRQVGVTQLKGIEGEHPLFEVVWDREPDKDSGP